MPVPRRVLLAQAPFADTFGYAMPPPGLLRLGAVLERAGVPVELCDLAYHVASGELTQDDELAERCAERLLAREPDVLGVSTMGATLPIALSIAEAVARRSHDVHVWLGGPGVGGVDEAVLERCPAVSAVVRGEGERTVPELVERVRAGESPAGVHGVTWRDANGRIVREPERAPLEDLGQLPPYAWHLLPSIAEYKRDRTEPEGLVPIDSGRGCVYDCTFCSIPRFWGRRSRTLPARRLAEEMLALESIDGARNAYLCHDLFGADRRHALELCRLLERAGARVPFEIRARLDHLDDELIEGLGRAGCYRVLLGLESADGDLRNANGKRMDTRLPVLERLDSLRSAGIVPILSLILGLPGEGDPELRRTLDLCLAASLRQGVHLSLHLPNPQAGCRLGDERGGRARRLADVPPDMALGAGTTAPERAWIEAHPDLFGTFALWVEDDAHEMRWRELHRIAAALPPLLERYPKSFALLARRRGQGVLDLCRDWLASGRSFEALVAAERDPRADRVLAWEQAVVREAARGNQVLGKGGADPLRARPGPASVPQTACELVELDGDPRRLVAWLTSPEVEAEPELEDVVLAVCGRAASTRSLRVSRDVAGVLQLLDGRPLSEYTPPLAKALKALARQDLVRFEPDSPSP